MSLPKKILIASFFLFFSCITATMVFAQEFGGNLQLSSNSVSPGPQNPPFTVNISNLTLPSGETDFDLIIVDPSNTATRYVARFKAENGECTPSNQQELVIQNRECSVHNNGTITASATIAIEDLPYDATSTAPKQYDVATLPASGNYDPDNFPEASFVIQASVERPQNAFSIKSVRSDTPLTRPGSKLTITLANILPEAEYFYFLKEANAAPGTSGSKVCGVSEQAECKLDDPLTIPESHSSGKITIVVEENDDETKTIEYTVNLSGGDKQIILLNPKFPENEWPIDPNDPSGLKKIPHVDPAGGTIMAWQAYGLDQKCYSVTIYTYDGQPIRATNYFASNAPNVDQKNKVPPPDLDNVCKEYIERGNPINRWTFDNPQQVFAAFYPFDERHGGFQDSWPFTMPMLPDGTYTLVLSAVQGKNVPDNFCLSCGDTEEARQVFIVGDGKPPAPPTPPCTEVLIQDNETKEYFRMRVDSNDLEWYEDLHRDNQNWKFVKCTEVATAFGPFRTDPREFIQTLMGILLSISGAIAVGIIIFAGYRVMASNGDPEKVGQAKEMLTSAIVGLLFLIFSLVILEVIGVDILKIPGICAEDDRECQQRSADPEQPTIPPAPTTFEIRNRTDE